MTDMNTSKQNIQIRNEALRPNKKQRIEQESNYMQQCSDVEGDIHAHDILCGRDHFAHNHEGNANYRKLVKHHKLEYVSGTKQEKKQCSLTIYNKIRALDPPGRFLKYDSDTSTWKDIGEKDAIIKICQALREGAPSLRDSLKGEQAPSNSNVYLNQKEPMREETVIQSTVLAASKPVAEAVSSTKNISIHKPSPNIRTYDEILKNPQFISSNQKFSKIENGNIIVDTNIQPTILSTENNISEDFLSNTNVYFQRPSPYIISRYLPPVLVNKVSEDDFHDPLSKIESGNAKNIPKRYF